MRFLGPVFWFDLVRIARRQKVTLWRVVYATTLLAALLLLYVEKLPQADLFDGGRVPGDQLAQFATSFFYVFICVQLLAVIAFTPALAANALAEERGRNTLIFLLTTQLTNPQIVFGKLFTRLLQVGMLLLTGLPVLALMQLFGGVDLNLIIVSFAAVALTAVSLGCIGVACAVIVRRPQNAAWRAYQWLILYIVLSALSIWYFEMPFGSGMTWRRGMAAVGGRFAAPWFARSFSLPADPHWWQSFLEGFNAGNPYYAFQRMEYEQAGGASHAAALATVFRDFAIFHGLIVVLAGGYAVLRIRRAAASQTAGLVSRKMIYLKPAPHPPIRNRPMLWKELYCEAKPRQRWLALFFSRWFFFVSFLPAWVIFLFVLDDGFSKLATYTVVFLRYGGTMVACLLCIRVALQAARSIGGERERETLDSLLATDLTAGEIIGGKWWGSFLNCRWILVWLLVHWCLGVLTMSVHWASVPLLFIEVAIFAAFSVSVGLFCAARFRTSKQALTATMLFLLLGTSLVPWLGCKVLGLAVGAKPIVRRNVWDPYSAQPWPDLMAHGLMPPRVLATSVIETEYSYWRWYGRDEDYAEIVPYIALGLVLYAAAAGALARIAVFLFQKSHRRAPRRATEPVPQLRAAVVAATSSA